MSITAPDLRRRHLGVPAIMGAFAASPRLDLRTTMGWYRLWAGDGVKILILGGYGVFGGRLAELLADIPELELIIAGRSLHRAEAFCSAFSGRARAHPASLDRNDIATGLDTHQPDLLVDASGPFQTYGADRTANRYAVVEACIDRGIDYLDFADAAGFVFGISRFDTAARAAGVFVLSGVSSFPVLTAAVLRHMGRDMTITKVTGGIAPSPYAGIGLNVMRAVVGYAGAPVTLRRDGQQTEVPGLTESLRYTIAVPGHMPLRNLRFSLVDVPDLQVLPAENPGLNTIWMGAGPVPESLHRALNLLAKARATLGLPSLAPLSGLFYRILKLMKFGEHRGGMFVEAQGTQNGTPTTRSWHLLAEGDDGPYIPSMAVQAIVRKLAKGTRPAPGARPATGALELADYQPLFAGRSIFTGVRDNAPPDMPLYRRSLGTAFDQLPDQVQTLHDSSTNRAWSGHATVRRGTGLLARGIARLLGFPAPSDAVPVRVTLAPQDGGELWTRDFGGKVFSSFQSLGTGRNAHLLTERFGPLNVALALVIDGDKMFLIPRRWSFLGLPMPKALLPHGQSFETERDGHFCFDVTISAPLVGLIVAYSGQLTPA